MATTDTQHGADVAAPIDAASRARLQEKLGLLTECLVLASRAAALEAAIKDRRARLELLMTEDKDKALTCQLGTAGFGNRVKYSVDPAKLSTLFAPEILAQHVDITNALYDGAVKAGVKIETAVNRSYDQSFKIESARGAEAKEQRAEFIESTKQAALAKVHEVAQTILGNQKGSV